MTNSTESVRRRDYLKLTGGVVAAGSAGFAGCLGDDEETGDGGGTGTLSTEVTDQPGDIGDFESCVVTIEGIWVKPASGEGDDEDSTDDSEGEDGSENSTGDDGTNETDGDEIDEQDEADVDQSDEREYHEFDEPQEADLVNLQGDETQLVDDRELSVREYEFLQLDVSAVDAELADGTEATVSTPGNAPLQFKTRFEIRDGQRTTFVADFTPVRRGQTDEYLLRPVAQGTTVSYEDGEDDADE